jgi:hypothetical protein
MNNYVNLPLEKLAIHSSANMKIGVNTLPKKHKRFRVVVYGNKSLLRQVRYVNRLVGFRD